MYVKCGDGIKSAHRKIRIVDLFTMCADFSYQTKSPQLMLARSGTNGRCPTGETMKYLAKEPLLFEPGERFEYSLCHDVLAAFVETVSLGSEYACGGAGCVSTVEDMMKFLEALRTGDVILYQSFRQTGRIRRFDLLFGK